VLGLGRQITPVCAWSGSRALHFKFCSSSNIFGIDEARQYKWVLLDTEEHWRMHDKLPRKGCVQGHVTSLYFRKCDDISETAKDRHIVAMGD